MPASLPQTVLVVAALAASLGAGCTSPDPTGTPRPPTASAVLDGVTLAVALDRAAVAPGDAVRISLRVENRGPGFALWLGDECQLVSSVRVTGPEPEPRPAGRAWDGDLGVLRSIIVHGPGIGGPISWRALERGDLVQGCPAVLTTSRIEPGGAFDTSFGWPAFDGNRVPAAPGPYEVRVAFPYLGRAPVVPPGAMLERQPREIVVELPLTVVGPVYGGIGPVAAADAVLGDPAFQAWLRTVPRAQWTSASLDLRPAGWEFVLAFGADRRAIVRVNDTTGKVGPIEVGPAP